MKAEDEPKIVDLSDEPAPAPERVVEVFEEIEEMAVRIKDEDGHDDPEVIEVEAPGGGEVEVAEEAEEAEEVLTEEETKVSSW